MWIKLVILIVAVHSVVTLDNVRFRFKCASAMVCVNENTCDQFGVISKSQVRLTPEEEESRAPLLPCKLKSGNGDGVCCRDPDYKDDWPANYVDPGKPKPTTTTTTRRPPPPPPSKKPTSDKKAVKFVPIGCPERNRTAAPDLNPGAWVAGDFDSGHGEFLWQAAVLDSSQQFLCGCYLTEQYTCATTASCVKRFVSNPSKIKVVVGVWDLTNYDSIEPGGGLKQAQFSDVEEVLLDPSGRDAAVIYLDIKRTPVEYNYYTAPICVDIQEGLRTADYDNCVITGWGNARTTPHWFDVKLLSESECSSLVRGFNPKIQSCARADTDICHLIEVGNGLQCRYRGTSKDREVRDVYWLRGVHSEAVCTPGNQIIVYTHIDMDWFDKLLKKRQDYLITIL